MEVYLSIKALVAVFVYSAIGLGILALGFKLFDKLTPGSLWQEIVEKQNIALAIVTGSVTLAIAQIIAASVHG